MLAVPSYKQPAPPAPAFCQPAPFSRFTARRFVTTKIPICCTSAAPQPPETLSTPEVSDRSLHERVRELTSDWGTKLQLPNPNQSIKIIQHDPPLFLLPDLLTPSQAADIIAAQSHNQVEASLYLNYRVNSEVSAEQTSDEAAALLASTPEAAESLEANMRSGFRAQVPPELPELQPLLHKISHHLGFAADNRKSVFNDGAWIRPNRRQFVYRDVTTVHYKTHEGVPPHIDGRDITVLVGLQPPEKGGRTVFVDHDLAIRLSVGHALLYSSKHHLLHFAEPVLSGEKWVLQMLIDSRIRPDEPDVDFTTGIVYS